MSNEMMEVGITIAGAGVIGLAIAAELSETSKDVFVVEKNNQYGTETSSRNSEVIHAGIYYPPSTLKAKLCVEGRKRLYAWCAEKRVRHLKCGKLIVATTPEEVAYLEQIKKNAEKNGVGDLKFLSQKDVFALSPKVKCDAALLSPSTGIIDSHGLMRSFYAKAKNNRANFIFGTTVTSLKKNASGKYTVTVVYPDGKPFSFLTSIFVNCSGHFSDKLAATMGIDIDRYDYRQYFWKGEYFSVGTDTPFPVHHLVYPVPLANHTGLGIHATIDVNGRLKLGPNAKFLENNTVDYSVDTSEINAFYEAAKRYLPFIKKNTLKPEMAGIRPKLQKPGDPARDFIINEESEKGLPGVVNLIGMESPGLTSCLAISNHVLTLLKPYLK